jgi:hypothetical protein
VSSARKKKEIIDIAKRIQGDTIASRAQCTNEIEEKGKFQEIGVSRGAKGIKVCATVLYARDKETLDKLAGSLDAYDNRQLGKLSRLKSGGGKKKGRVRYLRIVRFDVP